MNDGLPAFRYHPDPLATGSATPVTEPCDLCGVPRGFKYEGPISGGEADNVCLTCIASGRAANELSDVVGEDAHFTDAWGAPAEVPAAAVEEITCRTPGFYAWQQAHWMYHCNDGAAFLGLVGFAELEPHPDAIEMLLHENDEFGWTAEESQSYLRSLRTDGDATGYLFQCLHCGIHLAYTDMS